LVFFVGFFKYHSLPSDIVYLEEIRISVIDLF
jgi:hypothetical protein